MYCHACLQVLPKLPAPRMVRRVVLIAMLVQSTQQEYCEWGPCESGSCEVISACKFGGCREVHFAAPREHTHARALTLCHTFAVPTVSAVPTVPTQRLRACNRAYTHAHATTIITATASLQLCANASPHCRNPNGCVDSSSKRSAAALRATRRGR